MTALGLMGLYTVFSPELFCAFIRVRQMAVLPHPAQGALQRHHVVTGLPAFILPLPYDAHARRNMSDCSRLLTPGRCLIAVAHTHLLDPEGTRTIGHGTARAAD